MNLQNARIIELCQQLKLERMAANWAGLAQQAANQEQSFADFLGHLLRTEAEACAKRSCQTLLKMATLPALKILEQYDFVFASGAPRAQLQDRLRRTRREHRAARALWRGQKPLGLRIGVSGDPGRYQDALHHRR